MCIRDSLTSAGDSRPGSIVQTKEILSTEKRERKVLMYAYPLQGGCQGHPNFCAKHKNKTFHLGDAHFICHVLDRYAEETGRTPKEVWADSVHPTAATQEHLRTWGINYASE